MKKIISILLIFTMVLSITASIPFSALATTTDKVQSGLTYTDEYGEWTYEFTEDGNGCKITSYDESMIEIKIPSEIDGIPVTEIGDEAFKFCRELISVIIPDSVAIIGDSAFFLCENLTSITIPDSVTTISYYAFGNCARLNSITIPNSVTTIGDYAFAWCSNLTNVTISDNLNTIPKFAFWNCINLTSITIPYSVTSIEYATFYGCIELTSIIIPNSVTRISNDSFYNCVKLSDIYYTGSKSEWNSISIGSNAGTGDYDYFKKANIHFNYVLPKAGDISGDGEISIIDVIYLLKYINGGIELTEEQLVNADLNNDSEFTIVDVILIQKIIIV
ncbi:MAG: leucine-rich repeat protein [Acutalibacteraceae bacterium]|nr:leucine-rich repeat protein [Acutalibacteraceae bacterium]